VTSRIIPIAVLLACASTAACRTGTQASPAPAPSAAHEHDGAMAMPMPMPMPASASPAAAPMAAAPRDTAADRRRGFTDADVAFMTHMIAHHAQAVWMTGLVEARTQRPDLRLVAKRIELTQQDEMALMRRWLQDRGQPVPASGDPRAAMGMSMPMDGHAMPMGEHAMMPGMLSADEMSRLEASTGTEFDRRFLEGMIRHHEGALVMVAQLFGTPGAGQESEIFRFASDVDADQRAEIARMRTLLGTAAPQAPRG
jgi:uncharacterized protein (DUF305 family)